MNMFGYYQKTNPVAWNQFVLQNVNQLVKPILPDGMNAPEIVFSRTNQHKPPILYLNTNDFKELYGEEAKTDNELMIIQDGAWRINTKIGSKEVLTNTLVRMWEAVLFSTRWILVQKTFADTSQLVPWWDLEYRITTEQDLHFMEKISALPLSRLYADRYSYDPVVVDTKLVGAWALLPIIYAFNSKSEWDEKEVIGRLKVNRSILNGN